MPIEITICLLDVFLPIAILMYNIKTINYEKYIKNMLKGSQIKIHISEASLFLVLRKEVDITEFSEDFMNAVQCNSNTSYKSKSDYMKLAASAERKSVSDAHFNNHRESLESSLVTEDYDDYDSEAYKKNYQSIRMQEKMGESIISRSVVE
jgi:hypothetical protein